MAALSIWSRGKICGYCLLISPSLLRQDKKPLKMARNHPLASLKKPCLVVLAQQDKSYAYLLFYIEMWRNSWVHNTRNPYQYAYLVALILSLSPKKLPPLRCLIHRERRRQFVISCVRWTEEFQHIKICIALHGSLPGKVAIGMLVSYFTHRYNE
jgi:hypothetical protein